MNGVGDVAGLCDSADGDSFIDARYAGAVETDRSVVLKYR